MVTAPPSVYPGVDWITLTTGPGAAGQIAWSRARALAVEQVAIGNPIRPWGIRQYKGFATSHLRCGLAPGDAILELSGALADRYWREFLPYARNVTRFDTKVDVHFGRKVTRLGQQAYHAPGVKINRRLPPIAKTLYTGTAGGETCYVGAMGGRRLGRLYDKSAESPRDTPPGVWRYELQERKPFSGLCADHAVRTFDVHGYVKSHVSGFFTRHGISPWFTADDIALPGQPRRESTDMSTWKLWARRQVLPGVRRWLDGAVADAFADELGPDDGAVG